MTRAFSSLDALTNAVAESFSAPSVTPPCTLINVALDFDRATNMLVRAWDRDNTVAVEFYKAIRQHYISEQARVVTGPAMFNRMNRSLSLYYILIIINLYLFILPQQNYKLLPSQWQEKELNACREVDTLRGLAPRDRNIAN